MAAWFVPALKAVLPHVGTLITVAAPVFTRKSADAANQAQVVQQQISELQAAAAQNADHIKALAGQLEGTVAALHQAAAIAEARLRRALIACAIALAVSGISLGTALFVLMTR